MTTGFRREARILDVVARQVGPALYCLERLSQLRSRVGAVSAMMG